jgi:hypothetical protein
LAPGPPPLAPFGLVLHHDGSWTHEGQAVTHPRLRAAFDRSVRWLPEERKYVVQLGRFRGEIEVEEAGFFVRQVDLDTGSVCLSDRSSDRLEPASLRVSPRDGALVCTVKRDLHPAGLAARFLHAAQAELLQAVEEGPDGLGLRVAGILEPLPALESAPPLGDCPDARERR